MKDTAYIERSGGKWEAWSYSDGRRYILRAWTGGDVRMLREHLEARGYRVVMVS